MDTQNKAVTGARKAERVIILSRNTEANAWFAKFPGEGAPIETAFTLSKPYVEVQAEIARRNPGFSVISDGLNTKQSSKTDSGAAPSVGQLKLDGRVVFEGTEGEAMAYVHRNHPYSYAHAIRYEGFSYDTAEEVSIKRAIGV